MAHIQDGEVDLTKVVTASRDMVETWKLGNDLFWPSDVFLSYFKMSCQEAGYKVITQKFPNGLVFQGCKTPDDGVRPLVPGVIEIAKDFRVKVGISEQVRQDKEDADAEQLTSTMEQLVGRMITSSQHDEDAIPLNALKRRRLARQQLEGGKAGQEKEHDNATTEKPTKLNENDEMALFDGSDLVVVANNSSSSAAPAGGTGAPSGTPTGTEDQTGPEGSPASPTRKRKTPGTAITKVSKETATHASSPTRKKGQSANVKKAKQHQKGKWVRCRQLTR